MKRVTALPMAGDGDLLPVSALPVDGVFPTGTAKYEKRSIAQTIPIFDPEICIDCGRCAAVCPHATIRMKVYDPSELAGVPEGFRSKAFRSKDVSGMAMTIQVRRMTAPAAVCASTYVRRSRSRRCATRPSTWSRPPTIATPSGRHGTSSCRSRRSIATSCPTTR